MKPAQKSAYVEGLLDGTVGSIRAYTREDLKRRMRMASAFLSGDRKTLDKLAKEDVKRQEVLDQRIERGLSHTEAIYSALNDLMAACGLLGTSGTQTLMNAIDAALPAVFENADSGHKEGLFEDSCWDLASKLAKQFTVEVVQ